MDTLIYRGGEVKALDNKGKIGGHIVLFSTKHDPDTSGDYFDADTDFDLEDGDRLSGYYKHGFDVTIGNRKIATGHVTKDPKGLWIEAQLNDREEYCKEILSLLDQGALGYSSGALSHLVRREAKNKAGTLNYVTAWPLKEWSLLPNPCEPRTKAMSLKMWADGISPPDDDAPNEDNTTENEAAETQVKAAFSIQTVRELEAALRDAGYSVKDSKTIVSRFTLRDVDVTPETITAPEPPAQIDDATKQARERMFAILAHRTEGLRLAIL